MEHNNEQRTRNENVRQVDDHTHRVSLDHELPLLGGRANQTPPLRPRITFTESCRRIRAENIRRAFAQRDARKVRAFQKDFNERE